MRLLLKVHCVAFAKLICLSLGRCERCYRLCHTQMRCECKINYLGTEWVWLSIIQFIALSSFDVLVQGVFCEHRHAFNHRLLLIILNYLWNDLTFLSQCSLIAMNGTFKNEV